MATVVIFKTEKNERETIKSNVIYYGSLEGTETDKGSDFLGPKMKQLANRNE